MTIPRLLLTGRSSPLLLGELYRFPAKAQISKYLQIHHLTLIPFKSTEFEKSASRDKIEKIATLLNQMQHQSARDLTNVIQFVGAPEKSFLGALIDCAKASSIWAYTPSTADRSLFRKMGWNI